MSNEPEQRPDDSQLQLSIRVGQPTAPDGLTRAQVDANGTVVVEHQQSDAEEKRESLRGELPEARELIERAADFPWDSSFPQRPGIPDEAVAVWRLSGPQGEREARFWIGDVESDERMREVFTILRAAVDRLSRGELFL